MKEASDVEVVDRPEANRFEATVEGHVGTAEYQWHDGAMVLMHVGVPSEIQGRGIASAIVRVALDQARARGIKVVPLCPFVAAYIRQHPEYAPLVRP